MHIHLTQTERNWATLAHLTALLTGLAGLYTGGMGAVVALLIPLGMYVYFSNRSQYVAYHALQATAFQALGGVALVLTLVVGLMVLAGTWIVTGLLALVLVGLALLPVALVLTLAGVLGVVGLSTALVVYPLWGARQARAGEAFEYPVIGRWAGRLLAAPAI